MRQAIKGHKRLGHDMRLMLPQYVKPYVKRGKNDATNVEAIYEAVTRPSMRFVPIKGTEQQAVLMLHRTRDLLVRQGTMLTNALRGHLSEFGIIAATGMENIAKLIIIVKENKGKQIPKAAHTALRMIIGQLRDLKTRIIETYCP
ncbi:Mobile element protein [hydrothermal vent metagenome]|uniref:Mobile element protein n=1 Tax=hydrothermal vent metagenome TaxID=652676 RepID=A0A3B0RET4_9ZZZZ